MKWFRHLLERAGPPAPVAAPAVQEVISDAEWKTAIELTRISAYQAGLAEGELRGRLLLANEIEAEFVGTPITGPDATRIRNRQVH